MELLHIIVLAVVQGLTEFLPISSSAHLILIPKLLGWPDQGLAFDVALHIGTLTAVVVYFNKQLRALTIDWTLSCITRKASGESRLAWGIIIATIPVIVTGLLLHNLIDTTLRSPLVIMFTTIFFGVLLIVGQWMGKQNRTEHDVSIIAMFVIGCFQAVALVPGTSRSGITMTAGLMLGLTQSAAARFSFLLSIPTIVASGGYKALELAKSPLAVDWMTLGLGSLFSGLVAFLCIYYFLKVIDSIGMMPFFIYRLLLGGFLFYMFW